MRDVFRSRVNGLERHVLCTIITGVHGEGYPYALYEYYFNRCRMAVDHVFFSIVLSRLPLY
jgi:hypothetical protein